MSATKPVNNLRDNAVRERDEVVSQMERIGRGLWDIVATTAVAADANPCEVTLASRLQTALGMYELWAAVVDGDQP